MIAIPLAEDLVGPASALMTRAFTADPFFTFTFPDLSRRRRILPWLFEKTIQYGQRYGRVITTASLAGIAVWLGPEDPRLTLVGTLLTGLFLLPLKLSWKELFRSIRLENVAEKLHRQSVKGRHWYLFELAVEPSMQDHGVGATLMQPILALADRQALPCYLETNNEKNLPFYKHYGFTVTGHAQAGRDGPQPWGMRREPALVYQW
jgi:GNAT superfamily N-acetyltransferase